MTTPATMADQRRRAASWRSTVALVFRAAGIDAQARMPMRRANGSEELTTTPTVLTPTELGLHVEARPIELARLGSYLSRAVLAADLEGDGLPVLVVPRQQHPPEESYAILRLADLLKLVQKRG